MLSWTASYSLFLNTHFVIPFRLSQVKIGTDNPTIYTYYLNGNRKNITYPDGLTQTYTYDAKNQIISLVNTKKDKSIISSYSYTYDNAGNQLSKKDSKGTTLYNYDALNRLSAVKELGNKLTEYQYDGAGNRSTEKVTSAGTTINTDYNYNEQNRLISTKSSNGEVMKYTYDNNGNMIGKVSSIQSIKPGGTNPTPEFNVVIQKDSSIGSGSSDITLFTYDNFNQLIKIKNDTSTSVYGYNAQGYRVSKTVNGKVSRYLYEEDKIVLETDSSNKQLAFQVYGTNLLYRSVLKESGVGNETYYYLYNAHGDVTALINTNGTIAATYDYDAFGTIISETGSANNPIRYAGYQYDTETGLYYLNARYYDSTIARFINEDTYRGEFNDPLSLNLYTYCVNNPITYTDPSGHIPLYADPILLDRVFNIIDKGLKIFFTGFTVKYSYDTLKDSLSESYDETKAPAHAPHQAPTPEAKSIFKSEVTSNVDASKSKAKDKTKEKTQTTTPAPHPTPSADESKNKNKENKDPRKGAEKTEIQPGDKTSKGREYTKHGADRANERGFDSKKIDDIIDNNKNNRFKEIDEIGKVTWRYQDKRGNTVITDEWGNKIITVYSYPQSANDGNYIPKW